MRRVYVAIVAMALPFAAPAEANATVTGYVDADEAKKQICVLYTDRYVPESREIRARGRCTAWTVQPVGVTIMFHNRCETVAVTFYVDADVVRKRTCIVFAKVPPTTQEVRATGSCTSWKDGQVAMVTAQYAPSCAPDGVMA